MKSVSFEDSRLRKKLNISVVFQDEILSTREAARILREQKTKREKIPEQVDSKAAQLILQSYLESQK